MLTGKYFGEAIRAAITLKIEKGGARTQAEIARHFKIKPPSLADWMNKGSIAKDKLPELWRYFSDVVGPEHWGMTLDEWPAGLNGKAATPYPSATEPNGAHHAPTRAEHPVIQRVRALDPHQLVQLEAVLDAIEMWHTRTAPAPKRKSSRFRTIVPGDPPSDHDRTTDTH